MRHTGDAGCGCVITRVTENRDSGGKMTMPHLNILTMTFFIHAAGSETEMLFHSDTSPSEQNHACCSSTGPPSKISPGHSPPYRKRQEMTLLDLAVRQHFLQSLLRGSEVCEKVD